MKDIIAYADFDKVELRVGKIVEASLPDWSEKLVRYVADFGAEIGMRVMFSGIREWYKPDDMIGNKYVFVVNMAPKKMGPEESGGMMVMADGAKKPILITVPNEVEVGEVVR